MSQLVITNGDSAVERLAAGGVVGRFLPWRDILHDGPVPGGLSTDALADVRADFISGALGIDYAEVRTDFAARDGILDIHPAYGDVTLWFEHDLYDQLQLIQLLNYFCEQPERMGLRLVQASDYLGAMEAPEVARLATAAGPLTTLHMETGRTAWRAFTAPDPEGLAALAGQDLPALPHLAAALARLLAELPAPGSGLSLTETRILRRLADGPAKVAALYAEVSDEDAARFLADLPLFLRLDALAFAPEPLIEGLTSRSGARLSFKPGDGSDEENTYADYVRAVVSLTPAGRKALAGGFDHARENRIDRWVGGTHLTADTLWRFDPAAGRLVAPS